VLSGACRRFRAGFAPGSVHPHRRACRECEAFAAALESASGVRLPLPAGLRRNLGAIAGPEPDAALPFSVPRLPVPDALAHRLRAIAAIAKPAPPEWVLHPRYAVAASALLALLLGPFLSTAAGRSLQAVGAVQAEVRPLLQRTGEKGREEMDRLRLTAGAACDTAYEKTRRSVAGTLGRLEDGLSSFSVRLTHAVSTDLDNLDPRPSAPGSVRRPK
jgi:hypothetical protein